MSNGYLSFLNITRSYGHTALFSTSKGGETAGSVANSGYSTSPNIAYYGGETAGSVASSSGGSSSGCSCSFTAIA